MDNATSAPSHEFYLTGRLIETTASPGETPAAQALRAAAILEMFRAFAPLNAKQAMLACDCIALEFVLTATLRDACDLTQDPKLLARARASGASLSRTLLSWIARLERIQAADRAGGTEAASPPRQGTSPAAAAQTRGLAAAAPVCPDASRQKPPRPGATGTPIGTRPGDTLFRMVKQNAADLAASLAPGKDNLAASAAMRGLLAEAVSPAAIARDVLASIR